MTQTKNDAAVREHNDIGQSATTITGNIIADFDAAVKRNDLREALDLMQIGTKDAVTLLRPSFPKLDKTVVSKCSRPALYGCVLCEDGFRILRENISSQETHETTSTPRKRHRSGGHR